MRPKWIRAVAILAFVAVLAAGWFYFFHSRVIDVWAYTDYAFRFHHPNWPVVVNSRFQEVNRIYQQNGARVRWKVLDSSEIDPTSDAPGIDSRRATMTLHFDHKTDIFVIFSGVEEKTRTGSVSPFTRVAVIVDYPQKSETLNARLLAHELTHLFGAPHDPAWPAILMSEQPASAQFSSGTLALIRLMRNYPFSLGIDGLAQDSWEKKALAAVSQYDVPPHWNALSHAHTVIGMTLLNERKRDAAIAHFRLAVAADPQNETARFNLTEAYSRNGQDDLALQQAREIVRLFPSDPLAHRALGALLGHAHQPEASVQELETAIRLAPADAENHVILGMQLAGMFGHLDDALASLQTALRLDPNSPRAHEGLEKTETLKQRVAAELVKEREVLGRNPNDPDANYHLAKAEEAAGDLKGAIREFHKAAELRPANGTPHTDLAELYLLTGDPNAAWAEIRKARELGTEPPQSLIARLPPQR